jgi:hypothetical protein
MSDIFDPTKITLTEQQLVGITYIHQTHMKSGLAPTAEKVAEAAGVSVDTAKKWYKSPEFEYMMKEFGIVYEESDVLTPQQVIILNSLLDLNDRRSKREKCQEAGITLAKLNGWMRDPVFQAHYEEVVKQKFAAAEPVAQLALLRNLEAGNQRTIEFYYELTGKFQRSVRHDVNLEGFIGNLVEVLAARISDPRLLEQIADDIELLMQGRRPDLDRRYDDAIEVPVVPALTEG